MEYKAEHFSPLMGSMEYIILLICMVGMVAALFVWRQKVMGMSGMAKGFGFMKADKTEEIKIVAHKALDLKSRVIVLEYEDYRYVVLVGANQSLLLDKIPNTQNDTKTFQDFLKEQGNESS